MGWRGEAWCCCKLATCSVRQFRVCCFIASQDHHWPVISVTDSRLPWRCQIMVKDRFIQDAIVFSTSFTLLTGTHPMVYYPFCRRADWPDVGGWQCLLLQPSLIGGKQTLRYKFIAVDVCWSCAQYRTSVLFLQALSTEFLEYVFNVSVDRGHTSHPHSGMEP